MIQHKGEENRAPEQRCIDAIGALTSALDTEPHASRMMALYLAKERDHSETGGLPRDIDHLFSTVDSVKTVLALKSRSRYEELIREAMIDS